VKSLGISSNAKRTDISMSQRWSNALKDSH